MSAGECPQCFFYLLDRHALLAMTMGSKGVFLKSLTTPGCAHPSNGGELATYRRGLKFPSAEGWHEVPGWLLWLSYPPVVQSMPPPWNHPRKLCLRGARWAVGIRVRRCSDMLSPIIPALSTPQTHLCLRGSRVRE